MSDQDTIGSRLAEAREERGLTIAEAACRMAVKPQTLKSWESGSSAPRSNKLHMLAGILSVPIAWLIDGNVDDIPGADRWSRLERLEQKFERMNELQSALLELSTEIAEEIASIRKIDEELEELAA